jgi:biopolymer transport protein ExbD
MRTFTHPLAAGAPSSGIDLAPMLDFVTNLLIFFLVAAIFIRQPGITVDRPDSFGEGNTAKSIVIADNGEISIDNRVVDLHAVRAHIEQYRATGSEDGVVIVAHEHAPTGVLVAVADQVHLGGVRNVSFSTGQ